MATAFSDPKSRSCLCSLFVVASLICGAYFIGSAFIEKEYKERLARWKFVYGLQNTKSDNNMCQNRCYPLETAALPKGIIAETSNLEMQPLWGATQKNNSSKSSLSLLAIAVGINQKEVVNKIVQKFPTSDFRVMLFHYDGFVDKWRDLPWSDLAIHVSAANQTKWWFAKRFLHPDIVVEYDYIFLWDEDLGVENFDPKRGSRLLWKSDISGKNDEIVENPLELLQEYLSIVQDEGLEISQPALDTVKSVVYHPITARRKRSRVHRRYYKFKGSGRCDDHSSSPPCVGIKLVGSWVEMMAPVFTQVAWKCVWHMIQNDLIHAWGLDIQLGYCSQGDRVKKVGVVDAEYVVHMALPTLGVTNDNKARIAQNILPISSLLSCEELLSYANDVNNIIVSLALPSIDLTLILMLRRIQWSGQASIVDRNEDLPGKVGECGKRGSVLGRSISVISKPK
ncbi:hypothetical protein TIFTF001_004037 [Ficus carica]|uniref:Uncharacterized protein n=1 Tax=Ficus carica TaxID=3494 RepID=A0AA88DBY4_FICCA|nr:hypothetical protein TIFTF001_004037 [Ficus carica]